MSHSRSVDVGHWHNSTNGTLLCDVGDEAGALVVIGIAIGLASSIAINVGQNIQALGAKALGKGQQPCASRTWVLGLALFIIGSIGNMLAMAFASATILVPLESSQFVTNILFSKLINKAGTTWRQWLGTWIAVFGTVLTCVFGPNDARCFTLGQLETFWSQAEWIGFLIGSAVLSALGWLAYWRLRSLRDSPLAEGGLPALFAVSSALVGGSMMIVHSKALAELGDMLAGGAITLGDLLCSWFFWTELAVTTGCGTFWAIQMNASLQLYDPLFIIPLLQASYITFGSVASATFYQEFRTLSDSGYGVYAWPGYVSGVCLVVVGILLLAPPHTLAACSLSRRAAHRSLRPLLAYDTLVGAQPMCPGASSGSARRPPSELPDIAHPLDAKDEPLLTCDDEGARGLP